MRVIRSSNNRRRSIRLHGYDYRWAGAYFVTIRTHGRDMTFGDIDGGAMVLNPIGDIVAACLREIPDHCTNAHVDAFAVMPDHVHAIVVLDGRGRGTACRAPTTNTYEQFGRPVPGSLPTIIRSFKSAATRQIHTVPGTPRGAVWQSNYYERVIHGDDDLHHVRQYVRTNAVRHASGKNRD
jgi:putative transposase